MPPSALSSQRLRHSPAAVAAEGVRDVDDAGRPVVVVELAHGVGQLLEEVVRDGQVIDLQVEFAHRVVQVGSAAFWEERHP